MFLFLLPLPETQPDGDGLDAPRPAESYTTIVRKLHQKFTIRVRVKYTTFYSLLQNSYNEQQINYLETNKHWLFRSVYKIYSRNVQLWYIIAVVSLLYDWHILCALFFLVTLIKQAQWYLYLTSNGFYYSEILYTY